MKGGVDYFPLDANFFTDKKIRLLKGEFGARGLLIVLSTLCRVYSTNGYYASFDDDDAILTADELGVGVTPELVREVVQGSVKRSLFDEGVFNQFGVLTSPGIQRRYIRAVSKRDDIPIIQEYWLLDIDNNEDVPRAMRVKVTFKSVSGGIKAVSGGRNPDKTPDNSQSKVKESKVEESRSCSADTIEAYAAANLLNLNPRQMEELATFKADLSDDMIRHAIDDGCLHSMPRYEYVRKILMRYVSEGYKTIDDILKAERLKDAQKPAIPPRRKVREFR